MTSLKLLTSCAMSMEEYDAYRAAVMLWKIVPPFLCVFGTAGNILTIIVLTQRRLRKAPTALFLAALAVSDILTLNTGLLRQWIKYTFQVDIREDLTELGCKFHWFIVYVVTQFSSWMLICVTVERVISTFMPHRRTMLCKMTIAYFTVCLILCFLIGLNAHYLFGYGTVYQYTGNETIKVMCVTTTVNYDHFIMYAWTWIDMGVFYLVPMLVLLVGNSMIIYKVLDSHRRCRQTVVPAPNPTQNKQDTIQRRKISSLTILLLLVSVLFIVCITPIVVYPAGEPYWKEGASDHKLATMFLFETMSNVFMYVNHSVNFILYFLSGSKFRNEVKMLVCGIPVPMVEQTTLSARSGVS